MASDEFPSNRTVNVKLAYRPMAVSRTNGRLIDDPHVRMEVLRGRYTHRLTRIQARLSGVEGDIQRAVGELRSRGVAVRVLA